MKDNNLAACAVLQILIFAYFYGLGILVTSKNDIRQWSEPARFFYVAFSTVVATGICVAYIKKDIDGTRK